jgi:hypothetical protein
MKAKE